MNWQTSLPQSTSHRPGRALWAVCGVWVLLTTGGCRGIADQLAYNEQLDNTVVRVKHYFAANEAWQKRASAYKSLPCQYDFQKGFLAGYKEVANGGEGCTPLFPPRHYWGHQFRSAEGYNRVQAWFAGWKEGVAAAQQEGIGRFHSIPVGAQARPEVLTYEYPGPPQPASPVVEPVDPSEPLPEFHPPRLWHEPRPLDDSPEDQPPVPPRPPEPGPQPEPERLGPASGPGMGFPETPWFTPAEARRIEAESWLDASTPPVFDRALGPMTPVGEDGLPALHVDEPEPKRPPITLPPHEPFETLEPLTNVLPWRRPGSRHPWAQQDRPPLEQMSRLPPTHR